MGAFWGYFYFGMCHLNTSNALKPYNKNVDYYWHVPFGLGLHLPSQVLWKRRLLISGRILDCNCSILCYGWLHFWLPILPRICSEFWVDSEGLKLGGDSTNTSAIFQLRSGWIAATLTWTVYNTNWPLIGRQSKLMDVSFNGYATCEIILQYVRENCSVTWRLLVPEALLHHYGFPL